MSYKFDAIPPPPPAKPRSESNEGPVKRAFIGKPNPEKGRPGDIFIGFLLPPLDDTEALGYKVMGHFRRSANRWQACRVCTERTPNGDACAHVQSEIQRITGTRGPDGKPVPSRKAWSMARATTSTFFPFYGWKGTQDRPDDMRLLGSCGLEMDYRLETLFKDEARSVLKSCASCGEKDVMRHVDYRCTSCHSEVIWQDDDRNNGVNPTCVKCKCRVDVKETLVCSDCGGNTPQDPESGVWKIMSKRVRGADNRESNVWKVAFNHKKKMPQDVTAARVPMRELVEYCSDFETGESAEAPAQPAQREAPRFWSADQDKASDLPAKQRTVDDDIPF